MKPSTKKVLLVGGLFAAGLSVLAYNKAKNLSGIFDQMTIRPHGIPKNIKINLTQITFDIDIVLNNPTGQDFAVSGYVATLSQVMVYFKGKFLGVANVLIDDISVPRYDSLVLKNIPVTVATSTILSNIMTIYDQLQSTTAMSDIKFTAVVDVLGVNYEIGT